MLAIFDNDGTICDTHKVQDVCYVQAVEHVTGKPLPTLDWYAYDEPTCSAIVRDLLAGDIAAERKGKDVEREFVRLLEKAHQECPDDLSPVPGVVEFIERLRKDRICSVAIATGCFEATTRFKLRCCGIILDAFPYASASDTPRRRDIIPLAASRAGFDLTSVVFFGDDPWDHRVSTALGIPMIGIGRRCDALRDIGVRHTFRDYSEPDRIIEVLSAMKKNMPNREVLPSTLSD